MNRQYKRQLGKRRHYKVWSFEDILCGLIFMKIVVFRGKIVKKEVNGISVPVGIKKASFWYK